MNLPNCIAMFLLVLAFTTFLLGLYLPLSASLKSPLELIEQTGPITGHGRLDNPALAMVKNFPWLLPTFLFLASTLLALLLAASGLTIWRLAGRRRILQIEREASLQMDREELLQRLLDEHAEALLRPKRQQRAADIAKMASDLQKLDPGRRRRFDMFHQASQQEHTVFERTHPEHHKYRTPFHQKKILARALAIGFALLGVFMILSMTLPLFFVDLMISFYKEAIGIEFGAKDVILTAIFVWILALNPLGLSVGFLRLSSIESRLQKVWHEGLIEARGLLLVSYRRQVEALAAKDPTRTLGSLPILRDLTCSALPELDALGKRAVLEVLHDHGFIGQDDSALDSSSMDFSSADLRKMVLHDVCLKGLDLQRATLAEADLSMADLSGAKLEGADLRNSNLRGACLREADLRFARLHKANLLQADLSGAQLEGAKLWQAKLRGVDLTHVQVDASQLAAADR